MQSLLAFVMLSVLNNRGTAYICVNESFIERIFFVNNYDANFFSIVSAVAY